MKNVKIKIEANVSTSLQIVWSFWTDPKHITQWNFASETWRCPWATNDLKVGGKFCAKMEAKDGSFGFELIGIYDEVVLHKRLAYTMEDGRKVVTDFQNQGSFIKIVTIFDAEKENSEELQKAGWQAILDNFKRYAEKSSRSDDRSA